MGLTKELESLRDDFEEQVKKMKNVLEENTVEEEALFKIYENLTHMLGFMKQLSSRIDDINGRLKALEED